MDDKQRARLAELEQQFLIKNAERVTPDTPVEEGDWLRFEVDRGWNGTFMAEGEVIKVTELSIVIRRINHMHDESPTARIRKEPDILRRRKVTRSGTFKELVEYRELGKLRNAEREEQRRLEIQEAARRRQHAMDRADAKELLAQEYPERFAELLAKVIAEREG